MGLYRNVSSQKIAVFAWDTANDVPKTGDAANITAQISKDFGAAAATNDVNPTELDATDHPGVYVFDLTQAETNADNVLLSAVSSTADIELDPVQVFTVPPNFRALGINNSGHVSRVTVADAVTSNNDKTGYGLADGAITTAKLADGALTAAKFASGAFDAVWSVATRTLTGFGSLVSDMWSHATRLLTGGDNIVLAKGTGVTGFNDLSAAQVNAEADTALADYAPPTKAELDSAVSSLATASALSTLDGKVDTVDTVVDAIKAKTDNLPTDPADASDIASSLSSLASTLATILGHVDTEVAAIKAKTDTLPTDPADQSAVEAAITAAQTALAAAIAALNNLSAAQVATEISDALRVDTVAALTSVPAANAPIAAQLAWVFMRARNKQTLNKDTGVKTVYADDGSTAVGTGTDSDDGTTYTSAEVA